MHHHWRDHFSPSDTGFNAIREAHRLHECGYLNDEALLLALDEIDTHGRVRDRTSVRAAKLARRARLEEASATAQQSALHPVMQQWARGLFATARVETGR